MERSNQEAGKGKFMRIKTETLKSAALLLTCLLGIWSARAEVLVNTVDSFSQTVDVTCDGDVLDQVAIAGDLHILMTETTDKRGGVVTTYHFQPVNVSAVGLTTGDTYRAVGLTRGTDTASGDNATSTFVNNFYIIGQKSGIKYLIHETIHVTVVDGEVVVTLDNGSARCL